MKKITITNAYTWYNKGDAGILLGTVNTLKKIYGKDDLEINVLSFTPEEDKKRYCEDKNIKNVYSNVLNPHPYKHTKMGKVVAIIKLLFKAIYYFIFSNLRLNKLINKYDNFKSLNDSNLIVVCGGGFLGGKKLDSLMHIFQIYINTKFKKPVYIMGTSIEPINSKIVKKFTNSVLKKVTHVFAREIITYDYLKTFMPEGKYTLIPDMAFMLEDIKENFDFISEIKKQGSLVYGLTVRKWKFPNATNPEEKMDNYINALVKFMNNEIEKNASYFIFVPQVIVDYANDSDIAKEIKNKLIKKNQKNFIVMEDDLSPIQIKSLIGNLDYFIGTRMHSNIFALSMKVPTVAIAYEKKTNGIMHTVGLDDYLIEIDEITLKELEKKVNLLRKNSSQIKESLNGKIEKLRNEILDKMNNVLIEE